MIFGVPVAAPTVTWNVPSEASTSGSARGAAVVRTPRLLLVESEPDILVGFANALEAAGFHIFAARDVTMGRCLAHAAPDVAIVDICACAAAGFARELWRSGVPVVTLGCDEPSGHASLHLRKPITVPDLRDALGVVFGAQ